MNQQNNEASSASIESVKKFQASLHWLNGTDKVAGRKELHSPATEPVAAPVAESERPATTPAEPVAESERPATTPAEPVAESERPATTPIAISPAEQQARDAEQKAKDAEAALQAFSESADGERLESIKSLQRQQKQLEASIKTTDNRLKAARKAANADKDDAELKDKKDALDAENKKLTRELAEIADRIAKEEQECAPLAERKAELEAAARKARKAADKAADKAARAAAKQKPMPALTAAPDSLAPCPVQVLGGDGVQVQFYLNSAHRVLTLPTRGLTPALLTRAGVEAEEWRDWLASSSPATDDDDDPEAGSPADDPTILGYYLDAEIARRLKSIRGLCVIRGRGVWKRMNGEPCYCDGIDVYSQRGDKLNVMDGRTVYYSEETMPLPNREGLTKELATAYVQLLESRTWTSPHMAAVLIGWNVAALIGGALEYRPHIWVTGIPNGGKSTLLNDEKLILRGAHVTATGIDTSEAGMRQVTAGTSLPAIVDELEKATNRKEREQQQRIIKQARKNTDNQSPTVQGIQGGGGKKVYVSANSYLFASVRDGLTESQDVNRFFRLTLDDANGDELRRVLENARAARRVIENTSDFPARLIGHALNHYGDIIGRAEEIREQLENQLVDSRRAKLQAITQSAAESVMLVAGRTRLPVAPWDETKSGTSTAVREAERLVEAILGYRDQRGMTIRMAVRAAAKTNVSVEKQQAVDLLDSYGLKYLPRKRELAIRHNAPEFLSLLKRSELPWTTGADILATARDATRVDCNLTLKKVKLNGESISAPVILSAALDLPRLDADGNEVEDAEDAEDAAEV